MSFLPPKALKATESTNVTSGLASFFLHPLSDFWHKGHCFPLHSFFDLHCPPVPCWPMPVPQFPKETLIRMFYGHPPSTGNRKIVCVLKAHVLLGLLSDDCFAVFIWDFLVVWKVDLLRVSVCLLNSSYLQYTTTYNNLLHHHLFERRSALWFGYICYFDAFLHYTIW